MTELIAPWVIDLPPTSPDPSDRATFDERAVAWVDYQRDKLVPGVNQALARVHQNATAAHERAASAAESAVAAGQARQYAEAAVLAAQQASGAAKWSSGTYADGSVLWSPLTGRIYRKRGNGAATADPATDLNGWYDPGSAISMPTIEVRSSQTAIVGALHLILVDCTLTLPSGMRGGETIGIVNLSGLSTPILDGGGARFAGVLDTLRLNTPRVSAVLRYTNNTYGWVRA